MADKTKDVPQWLRAVLFLVLAGLLGGGIWFYQAQEHLLRQRVENNLADVAQLKVNQLVVWRKDRLHDATVLAASPFVISDVRNWLAKPGKVGEARILSRFRSQGNYQDIFLADPSGQVRLSLSGRLPQLPPAVAGTLADVWTNRQPEFSDLFTLEPGGPEYVAVVMPLADKSTNEPVGAVILAADVQHILNPEASIWTPHPVETLLIERQGDAAVLMNTPRDQTNAVVPFLIPVAQTNNVAVKAVLGQGGVMDGVDYRGAPVLAEAQKVPGLPWLVVAKTDSSEIFADWHSRARLILLLFVALIATAGSAIFAVWQRNLKTHYLTLHRAEAQLRQSEVRFRLLSEASLIGIYQIQDDRFYYVNPAFAAIFGYDPGEIVGRLKPADLVHPDDRRTVSEHFRRHVAGEAEEQQYEFRGRKKDGTEILVEAKDRHIENSGQVSIIGSLADITERKLSEAKLRRQLERLNLLDQITRAIGERQDLASILQVVVGRLEEELPVDFSCVCLYDEPANLLRLARVGVRSRLAAMEMAMTEQTTVPVDENGLSRCVRGQLVYEPDIAQVPFPFPQRIARGGLRSLVLAPLLVEHKVFGMVIVARRRPDGFSSGECEFLKQLSEHVALASHQSQLHGALRQAYDDLRQTQQVVMQQERLSALGQMASGIAHDINNAISPVTLYTESLLEKEPALSARARDYLTTIKHAIDDVAATVARMREFYRQREPQLVLAPVALNRLVEQVIDLTRARWSDMALQRGVDIKLAVELAADLPAIGGVESEIREALINLVFNAVDAMPEGGTLALRTRVVESASPQRVLVEVIDSGVGMNEDTRRRCLEPFFTTKGERGTGLGLAMVYGMVKRHSAEIEIESEPGRGTTMRLSFTVQAASVVDAKQPPNGDTIPARLRILVVDDDPLLLKSLRDTLEEDGHAVTAENGGEAGINAFRAAQERREAFSVVITDLGMPHIDGRKVAGAIKGMSPATPVIMLTGWGQRMMDEQDVPACVDRMLNKPPVLSQLREALAHCCR